MNVLRNMFGRTEKSGASAMARRQRGFSLVELAIVVAVIGFLGTKLSNNMMEYQEAAEQTAVAQLVGSVRSALHLQVAGMISSGNVAQLRKFSGQNPMDWLAEKPANYLGEYYAPQNGMVPDGNWYFDMQDKSLVYLVNNRRHLQTASGEGNKLRFRAKLIMHSAGAANANGNFIEGVVLEPVVPYTWL